MKARARCPSCGEVVFENSLDLISEGKLVHCCRNNEDPEVYNARWEILESNPEEIRELKRLRFRKD
jgi:hypothetical protein